VKYSGNDKINEVRLFVVGTFQNLSILAIDGLTIWSELRHVGFEDTLECFVYVKVDCSS
jgi:hypothetical protein